MVKRFIEAKLGNGIRVIINTDRILWIYECDDGRCEIKLDDAQATTLVLRTPYVQMKGALDKNA